MEILYALARADVDPDAAAIYRRVVEQLRVLEGLFGRAERKTRVDAAIRPPLRVFDIASQVQIRHLGGELGRKAAGIKMLDRTNPATALHLGLKQFVHRVAQRRDDAHARNHYFSSLSTHHSALSTYSSHFRPTTAAHCPTSVKETLTK